LGGSTSDGIVIHHGAWRSPPSRGRIVNSIGVAYVLPILVVPALLVSHALVFWLLLRRPPPAPEVAAA
jgi:hypothetical protein